VALGAILHPFDPSATRTATVVVPGLFFVIFVIFFECKLGRVGSGHRTTQHLGQRVPESHERSPYVRCHDERNSQAAGLLAHETSNDRTDTLGGVPNSCLEGGSTGCNEAQQRTTTALPKTIAHQKIHPTRRHGAIRREVLPKLMS
jgi:hypothetical protein